MAQDFTPPREQTVIALEGERNVWLTNPWLTPKSRHWPRPGNVAIPLVNGQQAFAAVHLALAAAKKSIDYITWGFDPAMRLIRPDGERLGDLLYRKATEGLQVRILLWQGVFPGIDQITGNGLGGSGGGSGGLGSGMGSTPPGPAGFGFGSGAGSGADNKYGALADSGGIRRDDAQAREYTRAWFAKCRSRLAFRTRGFTPGQRADIYEQQAGQGRGTAQSLALAAGPSHHQKVILVDYELPDAAVGFVMGHNSETGYWDTDAHPYDSAERLGFPPFHDLSCQVFGPVLFDINENFCAAWARGQRPDGGLERAMPPARAAIKPSAFEAAAARRGAGEPAQICCTQPQEGERAILDIYKIAIANARRYIYFENQYFRHVDLAMHLREVRRKLKAAGWQRDLYVFVVTNLPEWSGRLNTYRMLRALGQGEQMPHIDKAQRQDAPDTAQESALRASDMQGLNIHVSTLCTTGYAQQPPSVIWGSGGGGPMGLPSASVYQPPAQALYKNVYVHSKLMLVDDVFFTIGSANLNVRSLETDSEMNLAMPSPALTRQWRDRLWKIHTGGRTLDEDMKVAFKQWKELSQENSVAKKSREPLNGLLIDFYDDSTPGSASNRGID